MSYKEAIDLMSDAIVNFDAEISPQLLDLLDKKSHQSIRVYRKNYFFGVFEVLSSDFPSVYAHCEPGNFRYLVKEFLLKERIRSADIYDLSMDFFVYLEYSFEVHQDRFLLPLAKIDYLYTHGKFKQETQIKTPIGMFSYWCFLNKQTDSYQDIDLGQVETVQVVEEDGDRFIAKLH